MKHTPYISRQGLGGVMVWSIDTDDFTGSACGGPDFPLLRTINNALYRSEAGLVPGLNVLGQEGSESLATQSTKPSFMLIMFSITAVAITVSKALF